MQTNPFVGAWRLVSLETVDADGRATYPLGRDAVGSLTYTTAGAMCLAVKRAQRPAFASDDRFAATAEELGDAGLGSWRMPGAMRPTRRRCVITSR